MNGWGEKGTLSPSPVSCGTNGDRSQAQQTGSEERTQRD
jgi:hypothetical protein